MKDIIRTVLREETNLQNSLLQMINKFGLINASKSVGGMDRLKNIMGDLDFMSTKLKIDAIVEIVGTTQTEELDLFVVGLEPIIIAEYEVTDDFLQIEIVTTYGAIAMYYNIYDGNEQLGDTTIQYDALDPEVIDKIFDNVLWWYLEG
jgi:hypothetical protein